MSSDTQTLAAGAPAGNPAPPPPAEASASPATDLAIRVRDLSKSYRVYAKPFDRLKEMILRRPCHEVVQALHPLSFDIPRGQCVGVVGANGAGKTTLLSLLTGTLAPTTGTIEVFGRVSAILALGVGLMPMHSGRENIRHGLFARGIPAEQHEALEREIIAFSELWNVIDKPVRTYSSGMAMRLNFSIAHAVEPDILIVDEALAVGDAQFVFKCQKKMREFLDKGRTLFFVSHNTSAVRELCTSAILLDKGRMLLHGDVATVMRQYQMLYFGEGGKATAKPKAIDATAKQFGDGSIEIVSMNVQGAEFTGGTWQTAQGTDLTLRVVLETKEPIAAPAIGLLLTSGYGQRITGFSTVNHGEPLRSIEPGRFDFQFRIPLFVQAGIYKLELTIADVVGEQPKLLGIWDRLVPLNVQWADYKVNGLVDCGAAIEFDGKWYSMVAERERRRTVKQQEPQSP